MKMSHLYLPNNDNAGNDLKWVHQKLRERLIEFFGGFTYIQATGNYVMPDGSHALEDVIIYQIVIGDRSGVTIREIAKAMLSMAKQESVLIIIDDVPEFIR